jgi:uncharacterized protein YqeY
MITLKEQVANDFLLAFKARDEAKKGALSFLKAKITEAEKANKNQPLTDDAVLKVVLSSIKQRKQSIEEFTKANRMDLVIREELELKAIEVYLPKQLTEGEIRTKVTDILANIPDDGNRNKRVGQAMGQMNKAYSGQFDAKVLSTIINDLVG